MRISGATLALITGVAASLAGIGGALNVDAQPAAMFALGLWWWTIGKLWAETGVISRTFGMLTAGAGAVTLLASFVASGLAPLTALLPGVPDLALWDASRGVLAAWSIALGILLWRRPCPRALGHTPTPLADSTELTPSASGGADRVHPGARPQ